MESDLFADWNVPATWHRDQRLALGELVRSDLVQHPGQLGEITPHALIASAPPAAGSLGYSRGTGTSVLCGKQASSPLEALIGTSLGVRVRARMRGCELHAPAHLDAEVLSALRRLHRAGDLDRDTVAVALNELAAAPIARHQLAGLLLGAWAAREQLRLVDALCVELSSVLSAALLTTDARLARACASAELVTDPTT